SPGRQDYPEQGHATAPPDYPEAETAQRTARRASGVPAHRLPAGAVPERENVRPPTRDPQRPERRPITGAMPQRVKNEAGEDCREQDDEVPQLYVGGQESEHDDRD